MYNIVGVVPLLFGVSTASFYGRAETEDAVRALLAIEPDCFECFLQCDEEYGAPFGRFLRECAGDTPIRAIHTLSPTYEPSIFSFSPRQRAHAAKKLSLAMDAGAAAGAQYYVMHGLARFHHGAYTPDYDRVTECMTPLVASARERGMAIAWENVYWGSFAMPEFGAEMGARLPDLRFTLDVKQAVKSGRDWRSYIDAMCGQLKHVHVGGLGLPGQDDFDWAAFFDVIAGYDGAIILEPYADMFMDVSDLKRSLDFLRGLV